MTNTLAKAVAFATLVVFALSTPLQVRAQGNTWDKVRYNGGTIATKTKPDDWDNKLTITSSQITIELEDGQRLVVDPERVTSISYGQEAHRRVGTMIALGILVAPLALFGLFHKTKKHFIGVDYTTADGKRAGMLLQGHKDNFRAILLSLSSVTGQPIAVSPKDRDQVPANVSVNEVRQPSEKEQKQADEAAKAAASQPPGSTEPVATGGPSAPTAQPPADTGAAGAAAAQPGTVRLDSGDVVGDIYVDDAFVGNTPSQLKLAPGRHAIKVTAKGYADWTRTIDVTSSSEVSLKAMLEAVP